MANVPALGLGSLDRLRWTARKARLGIPSDGLVLDVGSGNGPHPRADVLVEKGADSSHRAGDTIVRDRPFVYADGSHLPFKDKAFSFVILSHVLEHVADPASFLSEVERVGCAGYIETPNVLFERLDPYDIHVLEVRLDGKVLRLRKKSAPMPDPFLGELRLIGQGQDNPLRKFYLTHPQLFHVQYWWHQSIKYVVENPEQDTSWFRGAVFSHGRGQPSITVSGGLGIRLRAIAATVYRTTSARRKRSVNGKGPA